ncbi:alkaline phosphatase family protein [Phocaeicola oris]|uniref:alkaline phosphatase family protein n=1 Tax=Phocaeicola oris TaxID=2896850 RepID=UPI00234E8916|nr:alkaline phosphatase family protein [Phocaeicola oris]MCE2616687.1 alkaline phosphatase family protein [Phocaeicola oris]
MKKDYILTSLFAFFALSLQAQNVSEVPKLVVGLTIDQLRSDYLDAFQALYGSRGFKRLKKEARIYQHVEYDFIGVDQASAVAAIHTGTVPYMNGIVGNMYMDRNTLRNVDCVDDSHYMGIYSSESTSPVNLKVSNLSDELMVATQGKSEVYSIAPTREMAVIAAGHAAKGAFWINDDTGKWSGSTFYGSFPNWVTNINDNDGLDTRIDNISWVPSLPVGVYHYLTVEANQQTFKHNFKDEKVNKYRRFKTSPMVNDEVNKLVNACLSGANIGNDEVPDFISIAYYAGNYNHLPAEDYAMEMQDTYARLDNSLADLLEMLDRRVGLRNILFFITSTGFSDSESAYPVQYRIPGGEFHMNRCAALLNMYLVALHGDGQYVETFTNQEIYLNHKLLERKNLNLTAIMNECADFLVQFSGVKEVYTSQRMQLGSWTPDLEKIKNHYNAACSGDIWVEILPGWVIVNDQTGIKQVVRHAYTSVPLYIVGWDVRPEIIETPIKIGHIAPTVAQSLRIRAPNASTLSPISNFKK